MSASWFNGANGLPPRTRRAAAVLPAALLVAACLAVTGSPAAAHTPHDVVVDIDFPSDYADSDVILTVVRGRLMRSDDRGVSWTEITRGFGGEEQELLQVDIAPSDPDVVYAVSAGGAVLRSDDGARSFRDIAGPEGITPRRVVVSSTDPDRALVLGQPRGLLARTDDGGASWTRSGEDDRGVAIDDAVSLADGTVVATTPAGAVVSSADDGRTWTRLGAVRLTGDERVHTLAALADGIGGVDLLVGTTAGRVLRSADGGATFNTLGAGLPAERVHSIVRSEGIDGPALWVSLEDSGPFRSVDDGATWEPVTAGLSESDQASQIGAADWTTLAVAPDGSGMVLLAGFDGLFLHQDGHTGWASIETLAGYIVGLDVSPAYADDRTLVVTTYVRGAFVSEDAGLTWRFANDGLVQDRIDEGNRFAPIRRLHGVRFSPDYAEDDTIFTADWLRVMRSTDEGRSWNRIPVGDRPADTPLRQYVLAPSPAWSDDTTLFAGTRQGELYRSRLSGDRNTWELLHTFPDRVRTIAPSPAIATDRTVFVSTVGGVYRSRDGGEIWVDTGLRGEPGVTDRQTDAAVQVAVSPGFVDDGLVLAATDAGLFRSDDGGDSWTVIDTPLIPPRASVEAVAFSPDFATDRLLLVSLRGTGLVRSTDGGATFEPVGSNLVDRNLVIADYANPTSSAIRFSPTYDRDGTIYAYAQSELVRSTDAGESWEVVPLPGPEQLLRWLAAGGADDAAAPVPSVAGPVAEAPTGSTGPGADGDDPPVALLVGGGLVAFALLAGGWLTWGRRARP